MNLPYQAAAVDRASSSIAATHAMVDPAFLSWDAIRGGIGDVASFLAPHAKTVSYTHLTLPTIA